MLPQQRAKLWHLPSNASGKDFVVGDLHGCYDELLMLLDYIKFDPTADRLFSVGDLVDRGPKSKDCANLIYEPWFFATRSNHEQMMIDLISRRHGFTPLVNYNEGGYWIQNGGGWSLAESQIDLADLAQDLDKLPFIIAVGEGTNRFHVCHAEISHCDDQGYRTPVSNQMIDDWVFSPHEEYDMIWGRSLIGGGHMAAWHAKHLSMTFVGHTPVRENVIVQRHMYIDGGAVFGLRDNSGHENKLCIAEPSAQQIHTMVVCKDLPDTVARFGTRSFDSLKRK